MGIVIYQQKYWNGGYGTRALKLWMDHIFQTNTELEHIGLTTWSDNHRMMRAAEKIGMIKEAQIRKVRYWKGHYYDSVKYGIIKEEWEADKIVPIPDSLPLTNNYKNLVTSRLRYKTKKDWYLPIFLVQSFTPTFSYSSRIKIISCQEPR
ncbi:MAG: GNAT family protein [Streptococcus suis]